MSTINQIKLSLTIGVLIILIALSGFPNALKTFVLVGLGIILIYVKVVALHAEKNKHVRKPHVNKRSQTFVESKPYQGTSIENSNTDVNE